MKLIPGKSSSVHRDILLQRATFHVRPSTSTRGDSCFTYTDSNLTTVASQRTQTIAQAEMDSKSGGTAPPQAAFTVPKASPEDLQPLIIPPPHPDSKQPHALVLLICGALLYPKDYQELTAALKQLSATTSTVSLWIAVATVDWAGLGPPQTALTSAPAAFDAAAQGALEAAIAQGFQPSESGVGRMENLFVALHSAAVLAAKGVAVQKAAGTILLGGNLLKTEDFMASAATYPRPLLHIYGQLDGQLSPCKAALTATEIATFGPMLGPKGVARIRPLVIIPGMNHAQVSNGVVNAPRGDLEASISHTKAAQEIAAAVLHFTVLYAPGNVAQSARDTSLDALTEATWHAVEFLAPFAEKLGRPNPAALLRSGSAEAKQKQDGFPPLALGFGAEGLPVTASNIGAFAHPGELAAAKRFAESAQRRLLESSLPVEDLNKVKVFAVAHTTAQTFMYSQSTILQTAPHAWSVQVHVLLERAAYKSGNIDPTSFVSPVYALKLKAAEQVAVVVGVDPGRENAKGNAPSKERFAANLNAMSWEEAVQAAPSLVRETYERCGITLKFEDDVDVTPTIKTPKDWIAMVVAPERTSDADVREASLRMPVVYSPVRSDGPFDSGAGRYAGACYIKCVSTAWLMEWMMVGGLRS